MDTVSRSVKRIKVLDVPIDAIDPDMALEMAAELLENGQHNQIVFLSVRGLLRARSDPEFSRCLRDASMVLPISLALVRGARFLGAGALSLFNAYEFTIRILSIVERTKGSVYLLGSRRQVLEIAEPNLRGSFHGLRVVGRYYGYFPKGVENDIVMAIKKSAPTLILAGTGLAGREKWLLKHKRDFNPGISLWVGRCFEIFAGAEKQVSRKLHAMGLGALSGTMKKPWRLAAAFPFLYYLILLLAYRLFGL
jgi:N-acetylglucosaminyldiphosphoundecaprenol N-acetyl-beta-D-mannosaminyltransferase